MYTKCFILQYMTKLMQIHELFLNYLENNDQNNFDINYLEEMNIKEDKHKMKVLLYMISKISQNHHRNPNFIAKIENILRIFKKDIKKIFTNLEIFLIFKKNIRILLFLFQEQIIIPDKTMGIHNRNYNFYKYFFIEFKQFLKKDFLNQIASKYPNIKDFDEKRKKGENHHFICELIRNDSIEDFISFVNKNNLSLSSNIEQSIFETNSFLIKKDEVSLIEYSAFYGSIQIFRYLMMNNVKIKFRIWLFAIHGKNAEIIHLLEEIDIKPYEMYVKCYVESCKCHHNDIMKYIQQNYIEMSDEYNFYESLRNDICFRTFNFCDILDNDIQMNESVAFFFACKYDHFLIVDFLLKSAKINLQLSTILKEKLLK